MKGTLSILIADDMPDNLHLLYEILKDDYRLMVANNGARVLELLESEALPDLILLDVMMPNISGYEACKAIKDNPATKNIPIIFISALDSDADEFKGLELGANDYISKPFIPRLVKARIQSQLELKQHRDQLQELVDERTYELKKTQEATIMAMGALAESRDPETGAHIKRTQTYVKCLALALRQRGIYEDQLSDNAIELIYQSAPLHDIGKVGIPDHILFKNGQLTEAEFKVMKTHAELGARAIREVEKILGKSSFLSFALEIAESHHEKWDGSGYPKGLKGLDIPLSARLMAVADVYDALVSRRVYKPALSHQETINIIVQGRDKHFDPAIVDVFTEIHESFVDIMQQFSEEQ